MMNTANVYHRTTSQLGPSVWLEFVVIHAVANIVIVVIVIVSTVKQNIESENLPHWLVIVLRVACLY